MTTFRELEAFVAVVDMGSFEKAARSLDTSQSAISRLIGEFEEGFKHPLFNRAHRSAYLTIEGHEVLRQARALLRQRSNLMERFANPELMASTLRLGVTELAAITWLGSFVADLKIRYPRLRLDLKVDSSPRLYAQMQDGQLDMAIVLDFTRSTNMARIPVGSATFGWFCASALALPQSLKLSEFERETLLIQGTPGGAGNQIESWLVDKGVKLANTIQSDSLAALTGICVAGLGIASLPRAIAADAVGAGLLREIRIPPGAPKMAYIFLVRADALSAFHRSVAELVRRNCDFDRAMIPQSRPT
ncbi:LysR family transcriptional regulator [Bordetella sp. BOR01]|uniref:LysR family transcriptional regulator n=1 Tax=Bordetella sp. BOR01 TaxID=2854779 RepID=UPI001C4911E8|nr:LysR family transcriptional regulator [Bordetella sp. BOR01]MBV7481385.1 LysR family transcriptional regulator [Bordetella sp. BOR01]